MSERERQTEFLQSLIRCGGTTFYEDIQARLQTALQQENSVSRKICALVVLAMVSLTGLAYAAIFIPDALNYSLPFLVKLFSVLALAALICMGIFLGFWVWCRRQLNRVLREAREAAQRLLQSRLNLSVSSENEPPHPHPKMNDALGKAQPSLSSAG